MAFSLVAELLFFDEKKTSKTRVLHETSRRGMHKRSFLRNVTCRHVLEPTRPWMLKSCGSILPWSYVFLTPSLIGKKVKKDHPEIIKVDQTNCLSQVLTLKVILPLLPLVASVP